MTKKSKSLISSRRGGPKLEGPAGHKVAMAPHLEPESALSEPISAEEHRMLVNLSETARTNPEYWECLLRMFSPRGRLHLAEVERHISTTRQNEQRFNVELHQLEGVDMTKLVAPGDDQPAALPRWPDHLRTVPYKL